MEEILHQLIGSLSQGYIYIYLRWFSRRISEPSTVVFRFALSKNTKKNTTLCRSWGCPIIPTMHHHKLAKWHLRPTIVGNNLALLGCLPTSPTCNLPVFGADGPEEPPLAGDFFPAKKGSEGSEADILANVSHSWENDLARFFLLFPGWTKFMCVLCWVFHQIFRIFTPIFHQISNDNLTSIFFRWVGSTTN